MKPYYQDSAVTLYHGDCLEIMPQLDAASVDMVLCDLPYGTTICAWDSLIAFDPMWLAYWRLIKSGSPVLLFASQPFSSLLVSSNLPKFRYEWIWEKSKASNFIRAKKQPLKAHESILCFADKEPAYFPQNTPGKPFLGEGRSKKGSESGTLPRVPNPTFRHDNNGSRYPRSVQYFATAETERTGALHPTQKPQLLCEYIIKTYSDSGATILDNCAGSGTTLFAAACIGRKAIGIEIEEKYCEIAAKRMAQEVLAF